MGRSRREVLGLGLGLAAMGPLRAWAGDAPASPEKLVAAMGFAAGDVGYILVDPAGSVLAEQAADAGFLPASVAKLATAYAAVRILGSGFRFATRLLRHGADIYLQGGGDPVLNANDLRSLAAQLRAAVEHGAAGALVYDDGLLPAAAEISDSQPLAAGYNPAVGALNVDFNRIEVAWSRRRGDGGIEIAARSVADGFAVPADWIGFAPAPGDPPPGAPFLYAGDGSAERWHYSPRLAARGLVYLPVKDAGRNAALVFRRLAEEAGIALPEPAAGRVPAEAVEIGRIDSPPLAEILAGLMRFSNNPSAELVGLAATRKLTGRTLSFADSAQAMTAWLKARLPGTDWGGFRLANHSGLSPQSRVTPRQMAALLAAMEEDQAVVATLPVLAGIGALAKPRKGPGLGQAVGKSGTMDYAAGLAGYLPAADGARRIFAIFIFDRARRAAVDATLDRRILEPSPQARAWLRRARQLEEALLKCWAAGVT